MTTDESTPASAADLQQRLESLLRQAEREGVDVAGAWTCRNGNGSTDWDVVVTELGQADETE